MEEQKINKEAIPQPTVEELKNYCNQLMQQRNQLAQRLEQVQSVLNKLPWLFKIVELRDSFSSDFVSNAISEIELIMTPPPVEEAESKESNNQ